MKAITALILAGGAIVVAALLSFVTVYTVNLIVSKDMEYSQKNISSCEVYTV